MPKELIGYRRLYDAMGCGLVDREEVLTEFALGDLQASLYFGSTPRFGITVVSGCVRYLIPGEIVRHDFEYKRYATESSYPRSFFTEIGIFKAVEVTQTLSDELRAGGQRAISELLGLAQSYEAELHGAADLVAGTVGLRFHRQFVLVPVNENYVVVRGNDDFAHTAFGPSVERLESPLLTSDGVRQLQTLLPAIGRASPKTRNTASLALGWLMRAWSESDLVSQFTALFIALEVVLQGSGGTAPRDQEASEEIQRIIRDHASEDRRKVLLEFYKLLIGGNRPPLADRFQRLAQHAGRTGWENDVEAFRRFNRIRNALIHRGDKNVRMVVQVSQAVVQELWDLAERYVSYSLFGDGVVYPSEWRPRRAT